MMESPSPELRWRLGPLIRIKQSVPKSDGASHMLGHFRLAPSAPALPEAHGQGATCNPSNHALVSQDRGKMTYSLAQASSGFELA